MNCCLFVNYLNLFWIVKTISFNQSQKQAKIKKISANTIDYLSTQGCGRNYLKKNKFLTIDFEPFLIMIVLLLNYRNYVSILTRYKCISYEPSCCEF